MGSKKFFDGKTKFCFSFWVRTSRVCGALQAYLLCSNWMGQSANLRIGEAKACCHHFGTSSAHSPPHTPYDGAFRRGHPARTPDPHLPHSYSAHNEASSLCQCWPRGICMKLNQFQNINSSRLVHSFHPSIPSVCPVFIRPHCPVFLRSTTCRPIHPRLICARVNPWPLWVGPSLTGFVVPVRRCLSNV